MILYAATFDVAPVAKGRPRMARATGNVFTPAKTKKAENELAGMVMADMARKGVKTIEGPVSIELGFEIERPKSAKSRPYPTVKPDLDNFIKLAMDALTKAGIWADDAQVVSMIARKVYSSVRHSVHVVIETPR